jgi:hypothetical protein
MSDSDARRAKPSRTGSRGKRMRQRRWLIAAAAATMMPAAAYVLLPATQASHDAIEAVIKQAGFDPLLPPSQLRGPGAIYVVDNGFYRKVCDADAEMLQGKIRTSPTANQTSERLETGRFSLSGQIIESLNARLGGSRVTAIEYRLTDAAISEIPLSELSEIEDTLLRRQSCDRTVERLLKANRKVCSGYAALKATTYYKVHVDAKVESGIDIREPILRAAQQTIELHTQGSVHISGTEELTGQDLFYGIQLSSLCITLNTATEPSVLDDGIARRPIAPRNPDPSAYRGS